MQAATLAARRVAQRRPAALTSLAKCSVRTYATPVPYLKEEEDPQLADYPRVPAISKQTRPAKGWDDPQMRRNFGEPLHENEEAFSMWGPDIPLVPPNVALKQSSIAVLGFVIFGLVVKFALIPDRPAVPREYPFSGLVNELGGLEENKARPEHESEPEE
ncbi:unnamed protein product [Somion occarium]|uniref:Uncharacterized protein n=1 Tax=Somion occarium TaxID=3059160 RepID=A0ABP1E9P0_9APHY